MASPRHQIAATNVSENHQKPFCDITCWTTNLRFWYGDDRSKNAKLLLLPTPTAAARAAAYLLRASIRKHQLPHKESGTSLWQRVWKDNPKSTDSHSNIITHERSWIWKKKPWVLILNPLKDPCHAVEVLGHSLPSPEGSTLRMAVKVFQTGLCY